MKVLVTGAAGFVGFHLSKALLKRGDQVVGVDSINDYYDVGLKFGRLRELGIERDSIHYGNSARSISDNNFNFYQLELEDADTLDKVFSVEQFDTVINLAAQAGVRYSLENPRAYVNSNIVGFVNVLEACRHFNIGHLTYASSSSVYGLNESMPFSTQDNVDHPISLYAASKKSNELMAHAYSHLFNLPTTGLRFFTVYGPWGRPDMAYYLFTKAIINKEPIKIFNNGKMSRDFTYVDDVVEGVLNVNDNPPKGNENWSAKTPDPSSSKSPFKVYNIGNNSPVNLMEFVETIEQCLGMRAEKIMMPIQPGDVESTFANVDGLIQDFKYKPNTSLAYGVEQFVAWYKDYHKQ